MNVGLVVHAGRDASVEAAGEAARLLAGLGANVYVASNDDLTDGTGLSAVASVGAPSDFAEEIDIAVSFGGDGTFLRAAHICRDAQVPVLGVNLGRLGFLAEVEVDDVGAALRALVDGEFTVETRATLQMSIEDPTGGHVATGWALNEVSIEKSARHRLLLMDIHVDGTLFAKLPADALILATSTGSTAYALSAGGPIVSPRVEATLVVPVAPHALFDRTVLASPDEEVRVQLAADQEPALVSCDGRDPVTVEVGSSVTVVGGGRPVKIARIGKLDFASVVRRKFGLR